MKKVFLPLIGALILIVFSCTFAKQVTAQGTCNCIYGFSGCDVNLNNCASGYTPSCTSTISECSPGYNSCTCTSTGEVVTDPDCGGISQGCCSGNLCDDSSLTCYITAAGNRCLTQTQIDELSPSGTPPPPGLPQPGSGPGGGRKILKGDCLDTAIGCIPINSEGSFFGHILGWAVGIGGGVAFLLIILATFQIMTSQGDPKRLQAGQELLYSAIMGLILLVLSVFVLRTIGVDLFGFL